MIAPEGIRDGQYFAEALYTFAGEGVEDLPFKKGDLIEVLDCADANWWRGKIVGTDEDGLFPACLVKFTDAPAGAQAMKTAERLAHLSDVLTPAYAKGHAADASGQANDEGSIESLLLNLANNEMQVQQQKVQAHMPRKPTRMKLLYEDHAQPSSGRNSSAMGTYKEAAARPPVPPAAPLPTVPRKPAQPSQTRLQNQSGLWSSQTSGHSGLSSFSSSIESMQSANVRAEDAARARSSGSMLFGPRGMPQGPSSRPSSRIQDAASAGSLQDICGQSYVSLYSLSDAGGTVARSSRAAHEAAISEARQLMDGIPSPTEQGATAARDAADYLFDDDDDDDDGYEGASGGKDAMGKLQAMISPASENSARFASFASTVSSQASSGGGGGGGGGSKRLPTIPSTTNNSLISDASSGGLGAQSSIGDLTQLHHSWYSSTDSLNLAGGGPLKSPGFYEPSDDEDADVYAPRMAKTKSRIRPTAGSVRLGDSSSRQAAPTSHPTIVETEEAPTHSQPAQVMQYADGGQPSFQASQPQYQPAPAPIPPNQPQYPSSQWSYPQSQSPYPQSQSPYPQSQSPYSQSQSPYSTAQPQYATSQPPYQTGSGGYPMSYQDQYQTVNGQQQQQASFGYAQGTAGNGNGHAVAPQDMGYNGNGRGGSPYSTYGQANYYDPTAGSRPASAASMAPAPTESYGRARSYTAGNGTPTMQQTMVPMRQSTSSGGVADPARPGSVAIPRSIPAAQAPRPASFDGASTLHSHTFGSNSARSEVVANPTVSSAADRTIGSDAGQTITSAQDQALRSGSAQSTPPEMDAALCRGLPEGVTPINYVKMTRAVFKFGGQVSRPETQDWGRIDRQMTMLKAVSQRLTVEGLATMHVGRPFTQPIERVRATFMWVASNIQYDASAAESTAAFEEAETPHAVLQRRRSRGPGFAYLFGAMMDALGVEARPVRGYLRQPLDNCKGATLPPANHVWNAVCLDGEYRLVDTACAARSHPLNAGSATDAWFFMAAPRDAIYTHFPLAADDQFLDPPVPLPVFWMLPYVRPTFFQTRVKLLNLAPAPRLDLKDDTVAPLVLCVRDSSLTVFAEAELHDPSGSGRIVARQPLLAQCMDYKGKRMVKILAAVRAGDARGLVKIYCGPRVALQPKRAEEARRTKVLGFLQKDRRPSPHDYSRIADVDEDGSIRTVATSRTYPLACVLPLTHRGRANAPSFVQPNAALPCEFYIKEPTAVTLHLGESIAFHLLPVGDERLFHMQLRSPSGLMYKFIYQPSDQGYTLRHTVKERGAWIVVFHSDADGWLPIVSYTCA